MHWVADAHYMCAPKGLADEKLAVLARPDALPAQPKSRPIAYDKGYFYPGPAVKDVPLAMAPEESQDALKEFGRPEYEAMIAAHPIELPLDAERDGRRVQALGRADRRRQEARAEPWRSGAASFQKLRFDGVGRAFGARRTRCSDVDRSTIGKGEFIALLGPSGCGKSTTLNILAGLLPATARRIWLDDTRIDALRPEERGFGMVFQNYALFPHMSVRRNIGFGLAMRGAAARGDRAGASTRRSRWCGWKARRTSCRASSPAASSSASRSRARSSIEPPLVLMDEPLSNLDAKLRLEMRAGNPPHPLRARRDDDLCHARSGGGAVARRPHRRDARRRACARSARREELYARPATLDVAEFMGFRNRLDGAVVDRRRRERERRASAARCCAASRAAPLGDRRQAAIAARGRTI